MTENIIDSEWSSLAKDDGAISLKQNKHDVVIGGEDASKITTSPTSLRYSPSLNKAKNITLDVPPDSQLEDLTYLGEPMQLFIDGELAFTGEIRNIKTQQKEGQDYSITARPPGKKLNGSDLEKTVNNEIIIDTIASIVDKYNDWDDELENLAGTEFEELNDVEAIGGGVRAVSNSTGTATYSNVGSDLSKVTSIYVKAYVPGSETLTLDIETSSTSDSRTIENLDKNIYGEWIQLQDFNDVEESYELVFNLEGNSLLIDWISIVNENITRETTAPDIETIEEDVDFYSRSNSELEDTTDSVGDGLQFDGDGNPQTRQISAWAYDPFPESTGDDEFVDGLAGRIEAGGSEIEWDFSTQDSLDKWALYARTKPFEYFLNRTEEHTLGNTPYDDDWSGSASASTEQVAVEDSSVKITGDADRSSQWLFDRTTTTNSLEFSSQAYVTGTGTIDWIIQAGPFVDDDDNQDGYGIQISSGTLYLKRYDAGSENTLDSTSYSRQENEWFDWEIQITENNVNVSLEDSNDSYSLNSGDTTHSLFGEFRVDTSQTHYLDDMLGDASPNSSKDIDITTTVDGNTISFSSFIDGGYREWTWRRIVDYDFGTEFSESLSGNFDVLIEGNDENPTSFMVSPLTLVHERSEWSDSDFDLTVHEADGHLDYPPVYADGAIFNTEIQFEEEISNTNIFKSTIDSTVNTETDVRSSWGPSQVIETDFTDFPNPPNSTSVTDEYSYAGVQHTVQYTLSSAGQRNSDSPREGFDRQTLSEFSVDYSTNNLEVLFDRDLSDNRLALMNSLASDSSVLFRWEGTKAKLFHEGQESTNIDLRSENINSSVSIEDVYATCEVIGLHNVRSGVIASDDAPTFVDEHKVIRTEDIESETDAINRARRFLKNHGSIKYKGQINTMPTFAPLGAEVDGSLFNHGQDMVIKKVRYSKNNTTITLGYDKDISTELISLEDQTQGTKGRASSKGMTIPVGEDQI